MALSTAFFSYSRDDSEFALRLAGDLKAAGAMVWLDQLDISPGERWDRAVEDALTNCPRMLVILSPSSVNSTNVMDEVSFALEAQKTVIPVLHRDCVIPFRMRRVQYADFRLDYDEGLKELLQTLEVKQATERPTEALADHHPINSTLHNRNSRTANPEVYSYSAPRSVNTSPPPKKFWRTLVVASVAAIVLVAGGAYAYHAYKQAEEAAVKKALAEAAAKQAAADKVAADRAATEKAAADRAAADRAAADRAAAEKATAEKAAAERAAAEKAAADRAAADRAAAERATAEKAAAERAAAEKAADRAAAVKARSELAKALFRLPDDAVPNNNRQIGPFCCTGSTVTVTAMDGHPVGYIYFYGWKGQAFNVGNTSVVPDIEILVSGLSDISNSSSSMEKGSVPFLARESPGTSKTVRVGGLRYVVTLLQSKTQLRGSSQMYFDMSEIRVQVEVSR